MLKCASVLLASGMAVLAACGGQASTGTAASGGAGFPRVGPCAVRAAAPWPRGVSAATVKLGFRHGETSISSVIPLADESFIVVGEYSPPGTAGDGQGLPSVYYQYRFDASGNVLEQRHDYESMMFGSPIDLTYFYDNRPGPVYLWRDAAGASRLVRVNPPEGIPFRDSDGRVWWLVHLGNPGFPYGLWAGGRHVSLRGDDIVTAAAGCDGAVWALASGGRIWRITAGGQMARVVVSLPAGARIFPGGPYLGGGFTALSDGTVWLATERDDPALPAASHDRILLHIGPGGLLQQAPAATAIWGYDGAEGPDGALWLAARGGLMRLSAHGPPRFYPAPTVSALFQDAAGKLWGVCGADLCALTLH